MEAEAERRKDEPVWVGNRYDLNIEVVELPDSDGPGEGRATFTERSNRDVEADGASGRRTLSSHIPRQVKGGDAPRNHHKGSDDRARTITMQQADVALLCAAKWLNGHNGYSGANGYKRESRLWPIGGAT
jgi:hypothetical protein